MDETLELALSAYCDEPCRICGVLLTMADIQDGAVFVGYSPDNKSRAAHKRCYDGLVSMSGHQFETLTAEVERLRAANQELFQACTLAFMHMTSQRNVSWRDAHEALQRAIAKHVGINNGESEA